MQVIVKKNSVVSLEYEIRNEQGIVIDSNKGFAPLEYVQGAAYIVAGLQLALEGRGINESSKITLPPTIAYGLYDDTLVYQLPAKEYLHTGFANVDDIIQLPDGREAIVVYANEHSLTVDANHPLAGQTLFYEVTIKNIRDAIPEEITCGHPLSAAINCSGLPGCC